jgi:hypothetical protein
MTKSILTASLFLFSLLFFSCESDEDPTSTETEETEEVELGANEVVFSDDNLVCTPFFGAPVISAQGILSVIMNQCQNSSSKLDGYFQYGSRPAAGTYTVVGTAGTFPNAANLGATGYSMVFYNHYSSELYSTSGTVELTVNADDNTKLDMVWTDVTMEAGDGYSVKFSGKFTGI